MADIDDEDGTMMKRGTWDSNIGGPAGGSTSTGVFDSGRSDASQHGTESGWNRHRAIGEPPCDECRLARNRVVRERRSAQKAKKAAV